MQRATDHVQRTTRTVRSGTDQFFKALQRFQREDPTFRVTSDAVRTLWATPGDPMLSGMATPGDRSRPPADPSSPLQPLRKVACAPCGVYDSARLIAAAGV